MTPLVVWLGILAAVFLLNILVNRIEARWRLQHQVSMMALDILRRGDADEIRAAKELGLFDHLPPEVKL
jgi:hypothetical protein